MAATLNPFNLLGDEDTDDPAQLLAAAELKLAALAAAAPAPAPAQTQPKPNAKSSAKPSQAVKETRNDGQRGAGRGGRGGRGGGGRGGFNREFNENENVPANRNGYSGGYNRPLEGDGGNSERRPFDGPRGGGGGFRRGRGGFSNGDAEEGERPRRAYDRRSGSGRGNDIKREGGGRANWGTPTDEIAAIETEEPVAEVEKIVDSEKQEGQEDVVEANKESAEIDQAEKEKQAEREREEKEMTLEEYEKVLEEKRKALVSLKSEERKVDLDKDLKSMQLLSNKKNNDEVFAKLGADKEKKKEVAEKAKKSVSINEFLKPSKGENYRAGGRGGGRGRGRGGSNEGPNNNARAPKIEDAQQFPTLGGK